MAHRNRFLRRILLGSLALCTCTQAQEFTYATNSPDTNTATLTGYTGTNTEISLPSNINGLTVTAIGDSAFSYTRLTGVAIPDSVTSIGNSSFSCCFDLQSIVIPDSVTDIGDRAFFSDNLTNVVLGANLTQIGDNAFSWCCYLQSIVIPNSVTSIGAGAFGVCWKLHSLMIPDSVTTIGEAAFLNCTGLTAIAISQNITNIENSVFFGCSSLRNIRIPDNVARIGACSFSGCSELTNVVLGTGTTSIDAEAFSSCGLATVTISSNVMSIGDGAFHSCTNLMGIEVDEANGFYCSSNGILYDKTLTILVQYPAGKAGAFSVPAGVTNIAPHAFESCRELPEVTIPDSVVGIGSHAFNHSGLTNVLLSRNIESLGTGAFRSCSYLCQFVVEPGNSFYSSLDGVLYNWESTVLIQFPDGKTNQYAIPDGTLEIGDAAFAGNTSLLSISFPAGLTNVGSLAFAGCSGLASVSMQDSVTHIGEQAFVVCTQLTDIWLSENITDISDAAFMGCSRLTEIPLPGSLTNLEFDAFSGCTNLTHISIPDGVTRIDYSVFDGCLNLTEVTFGQGVSEIRPTAFRQCDNLSRVYFRGNGPVSWYYWDFMDAQSTVYFLPNASGWPVPPDPWCGYSTAYWLPEVMADGRLGVQDGTCTFTVGWTEGQTVVVEAITNPTSTVWTPLETNTLTGDRFLFSDPSAGDHPNRFYRLRSP